MLSKGRAVHAPTPASYNLLQCIKGIHTLLKTSGHSYACVGGIPTAVLLDASTRIEAARHLIVADPHFEVSALRVNGTVRDIDLVLFTKAVDTIQTVSALVNEIICQNLPPGAASPELSISGYEDVSLDHQPWLQFVSQFIAKRGHLYLKLGHVVEEIPLESQEETWRLVYGDQELCVLHPIAHLMSYRTRSVTGMRPKDRDSIARLAQKLHDILPVEEWQHFKGWSQFERRVLDEITIRNALLNRDVRRVTVALGKAVLGRAERNPRLVELAQRRGGLIRKVASSGLKASRPSLQEVR